MRNGRGALTGMVAVGAAVVAMAIVPPVGDVAAGPVVDERVVASRPSVAGAPSSPGRGTQPDEPSGTVTEGPATAEAPPGEPADRILPVASGGRGVPATVHAAYVRAAELIAVSDPDCGLSWELLAAVGRIESGHASGGRVDESGTTTGRILGPRLDGSVAGVARIGDSDGGELDGDGVFDRAVGPMQFLPGTWARYGVDGNDDGVRDPHNVDDASLAAGRYLCAGAGDLRDRADLAAALFRYNRSVPYGLEVQAWAEAYRTGGAPLIPAQRGPVPEPVAPTAPPESPVTVLAAPDGGNALVEATPSAPTRPVSQDPIPTSPESSTTTDDRSFADNPSTVDDPTSEPEVPSGNAGSEGEAERAEASAPVAPTTSLPPTPAEPGTDCTSAVLTSAAVMVSPGGSDLLVRFPLDQLPPECTITAATLALDPGRGVTERAIEVRRVVEEWSDTTTERPRTDGQPVVADAAVGERVWSVDELIAALVEGPDHGVLLSVAGADDPGSLHEVDVRLDVQLRPAEPG